MSSSASADSLRYLRDLVYRRSAIVVEPGKEYLLEARLLPLAKEEAAAGGAPSLDGLVRRLREHPESHPLHTRVVEAMTTNETSFFRDVHPFETLKNVVLPSLIKARASTRQLRIWCAAASTGQEPYSIALTIREHFPQLASWSVQIVATDINETVLARARSGTYKQLEVNRGMPAPLLIKYFDKTPHGDWQLKPDVRNLVSYQHLNLLEKWPMMGRHDIVFIRNVLIYFDLQTKRDILRRIRETCLKPDGALFLGGAETTMNLDDSFEVVRAPKTVFYMQRDSAAAATPASPAARYTPSRPPLAAASVAASAAAVNSFAKGRISINAPAR